MKRFRLLLILVLALLSTSCKFQQVSPEESQVCAWGGAVTGAGLGSVAFVPVGSLAGAAVGSVVGSLILCDVGEVARAPSKPVKPVARTVEKIEIYEPVKTVVVVRDSDSDGVIDENDLCWNTPAHVRVDSNGCGIDSDGDGVPDHLDKCPDTPQGAVVDTTGCLLEQAAITPQAITAETLGVVNFATNSAILSGEAKSVLDQVVRVIVTDPNAKFEIQGHADSRASDSYNQVLSQNRAQAVVDYLVSQGVDSSQLTPVGKGESYPIASNHTEDGQAQNRRVEILAV